MIVLIFIVLSILLAPTASKADYMAGIILDSSSNMLKQPGGLSGTIASMYGSLGYLKADNYFSYGVHGGVVDRNDDLQFQHHILAVNHFFLSGKKLTVTSSFSGETAHYGDITSIDGYNQINFKTLAKSYLSSTMLLRGYIDIRRRWYREYKEESHLQAESYIRFDKFLNTGTTLRAQMDAGLRKYDSQFASPYSGLFGIRGRVAQSLGTQWGMYVEVHGNMLKSKEVQDSTLLFDRVFLDDLFKYSSSGIVLNAKHIFKSPGMIQLRTVYLVRSYEGSQASTVWYLPENGWDENEWEISLTLHKSPGFFPEKIHPSVELYFVDVNASVSDFSYSSYGMTMRFDMF
jgi:hypothetical protein